MRVMLIIGISVIFMLLAGCVTNNSYTAAGKSRIESVKSMNIEGKATFKVRPKPGGEVKE